MKLLVLLALVVGWSTANAADTLYVNAAAPDGGIGQSWSSAYNILQVALGSSQPGDEIWVARGTYSPDVTGGIVPGGPESQFIIQNSRKLYGGFKGDEEFREHRDWYRYPTILTADAGRNDTGLASASNMTMIENMYSVVKFNDPTTYVDSTTMLDGFIVHGAFGLGALEVYGVPVIRNCSFRNNFSLEHASVVEMPAGRIRMEYCEFVGNRSEATGALHFMARPETDTMPGPYIAQCVFESNSTGRNGACIVLGAGAPADIINDIFYGNVADSLAGAISVEAESAPYITNCNFIRNRGLASTDSGSTIMMSHGSIFNSVFWNGDGTTTKFFHALPQSETDTIVVKANIVENDFSWGEYTFGGDFVNIDNPRGADGLWNTDDDGLQGIANAQMKDNGLLSGFTNHFRTDAIGNARVVGRKVDIGAYEVQRVGHNSYKEYMQELRNGHLVVIARHFQTDWSLQAPGPTDACPPSGRNLSADGRDQARSISDHRKALGIPFGDVFSSPVCRCWESADIAFGKYEIKQHWASGGAATPERLADLSTPTANGNRFISTHDAVMFAIFGTAGTQDMTSGEVCEGDHFLVRPMTDSFDVVSHWTVDNWERYRVRFPEGIVGVEEYQPGSSVMQVFPNPAREQMTINVLKPTTVGVYDVTGVEVGRYHVTVSQLVDVSAMSQGSYYVRDVNGGRAIPLSVIR